jgi:SlyX protein
MSAQSRRMDELESQLAFQDELLASLNAIVAKQDCEIMQLNRQLELLAARLRALADTLPAEMQDEVPPHY